MEPRDAIGIDPSSDSYECFLVKPNEERTEKKIFAATESGIKQLLQWVKNKENIIAAIEGSNGQSIPLERALRDEQIMFYSFMPSAVEKFRKAVLGENKNNSKDAESVARYAIALENQGLLDKYKRLWYPNRDLQSLTRSHEQKTKMLIEEINRFWKFLRSVSCDLYLAMGGRNPEIEIKNNIIANQGILHFFVQNPNIYEWKNLSEADFYAVLRGTRQGRQKIIKELQKVAVHFKPISDAMILMIKQYALHVLDIKHQISEIEKMLIMVTKDIEAVTVLKKHKGISTITSSEIVAEIVDIRRFPSDDNLASYAGLVRKENSTGKNENTKYNTKFNRRLKNILMTAARNFVIYNPDSHLSGYYRNLVKGGMKATEARKRIARALVRVIFKDLYSCTEDDKSLMESAIKEKGDDMARGLNLKDLDTISNMSLPYSEYYRQEVVEVKNKTVA